MKKINGNENFRIQWTTNKKWLVYNDEDNKMYCTLCKK